MKPKLEKNIFIKRIINKNFSSRRRFIPNSNILSLTIDNNPHRINRKKCYIKPHPIFIISNLYKKNNLEINLNNKQEQNFIYIKANNSERNKYNIIKNDRKSEKYENETYDNNIRSKSYEITPIDQITKIKKLFFDKYEKFKNKHNIDNLNYSDNIRSLRCETNINNTNYFRYKFSTLNILEEKNNIKSKSSKSTDIVKLCKIIKTLNNDNNKETFINEEESPGGIITLNEDYLSKWERKNKYIIKIKKIIYIQKWWKEMIYKIYVKKKIINIQRIFRGYIFRKNFVDFLIRLQKFSRGEYLEKIIYIQKCWKKYLMLNNNQISMSFSFTNNEDNNTNNKDIIFFDNNNSNNKNDLNNSINKDNHPSNDILNYLSINKKLLNTCFFTKKYFSNLSQIISNIIIIQKVFKKYMLYKKKNHINYNKNSQRVYQKKNLKNHKNKSRNKKENITSNNLSTNKNNNKNKNNYNCKSLIIVSPERVFHDFNYHTPKKEKIDKIKFEEILNKNAESDDIYNKQPNNRCFINKIRKDINLAKRIIYLQKYIIKFLRKAKIKFYYNTILKDMNDVCYMDKIYGYNIINNDLTCKIIFLQINIKKFLKVNNDKNHSRVSTIINTIKKNSDILSRNKLLSTKDISDISNKKVEEIRQDKIINISEFTPGEENKDENNENIFISNNLNTFSFDFKNIRKEDIEDDDNIIDNKNNCLNKIINFSSKNKFINTNMYYSHKKLKKLFISNITNKFANFLADIINKFYLYNFIKIYIQRIKKSINQYVYFCFSQKNNQKYELIFFNTLKRHIKYNNKFNENNEIKKLLIDNIPKSFQYLNDYNNALYIPYINSIQENNLINNQLFINNDDYLVNYFNNFYINEKGYFPIKKTLLRNILNKYNLNNRNIFTLTKYFDDIYELIINNELCNNCLSLKINCTCNKNKKKKSPFNYIKKKCNYISRILNNKKEKETNINNEFFNMIDEEDVNSDDLSEDINIGFNNSLNNSYMTNIRKQNFSNSLIYRNESSENNQQYKFFSYLNEKCKRNKYNETLPMTHRDDKKYFRNNNYI